MIITLLIINILLSSVAMADVTQSTSSFTSTGYKENTLFGIKLPFDVLSVLLGIIVIIGGLIGYLKAGSLPSLGAGLSFGILILIGSYFSSRDATNVYLLLVTCVILAGLMGWRFFKSYKFMPAGLVALLSSLMILRYLYILITNRS